MDMSIHRWRLVGIAIALGAVMGGPVPPAGASLPGHGWVELAKDGLQPDRLHHALIYDAQNETLWSYGGIAGDAQLGQPTDSLFRLRLADPLAGWEAVQAGGSRPPPLAYHSAVYDAIGQRMIVYGGITSRAGGVPRLAPKAALWLLDLRYPNRVAWSQANVAGLAEGRLGHAAVYLRGWMVVSGGSPDGRQVSDSQEALRLSDLQWVSLPRAGIGARVGHALVYDEVGRRLLAYGGFTALGASPDEGRATAAVASLDLGPDPGKASGPWQPLTVADTAGLARAYMAAAFDPARRLWWVHGGTEQARLALRDLSILDLGGATARWHRSPVTDEAPARWGHAAAWDLAVPRLVFHGGSPYLRVAGSSHGVEAPLLPPTPTPSAEPPAGPTQSSGPAQATEIPPIATCAPPPPGSSPTPGLYPIVSVDSVVINQVFDAADCPSAGLYLQIRLRNDGPAPSGPFAMRIEGCGVGRREVTVESIDIFSATTVTLPDPSLSIPSCAIMLDPECSKAIFYRHWTGPVPVPQPQPTCTPQPSPPPATATPPSATPTGVTTEATPGGGRLWLPWLGGLLPATGPATACRRRLPHTSCLFQAL